MTQCITSYQAKYFAHSLTRRLPANDGAKFTATLQDARVDLTPHQIDAALFAFKSPLSKGAILADEDVWLTQAQLVEIYQSSKSNISEHLTNIFADKELDKEVVVRKFRTTTPHGSLKSIVSARCDF